MIRRMILRWLGVKPICTHNNSERLPLRYSILDLHGKALPWLLSEKKCRDCGVHWAHILDENAEFVTFIKKTKEQA